MHYLVSWYCGAFHCLLIHHLSHLFPGFNDNELASLAAGLNVNNITFCSERSVVTTSDSSSSLLLDNRDCEETGEALELAESKLLILILFIVTANWFLSDVTSDPPNLYRNGIEY